MAQIRLRFYQSLNDFIAPTLVDAEIVHGLDRKASVKDVIEAFNVPHTEIELILVNGLAVDFHYIVQANDVIQVYPASGNPEVKLPLQHRMTSLLQLTRMNWPA